MMKILVTAAGPKPAKDKVGYIINIAKRLGAEIVALHILKGDDQTQAQETLNIFEEAGKQANINVAKILKKGDIISSIIESAEEESVNLIIMGATPDKAAEEWISTGVMEKAKIPVVVIPYEFRKDL